jgi:hypothetical protein
MTMIVWDAPGKRYYETGIDRGVLYVDGSPGVPWNGLTSITKAPLGGDAKPFYVDGVKFSNRSRVEEYEATLTALTYPDEFEACDGSAEPRPGMFVTGQQRKSFGLSYRNTIGNDLSDDGYKINIVYGAYAAPTTRGHKTHNDSVQVLEFMWKVTALPPVIDGYKQSAHIILDSRFVDPATLAGIEEILYGTDTYPPRLPSYTELVELYDTANALTITDNGDGTYTAVAPSYAMFMLDDSIFQLTWDTVNYVDANTFTAATGT